MSTVEDISDRDELRTFLGRAPAIHAYALGDLAPEFWHHCSWRVLRQPDGAVTAGSPAHPVWGSFALIGVRYCSRDDIFGTDDARGPHSGTRRRACLCTGLRACPCTRLYTMYRSIHMWVHMPMGMPMHASVHIYVHWSILICMRMHACTRTARADGGADPHVSEHVHACL